MANLESHLIMTSGGKKLLIEASAAPIRGKGDQIIGAVLVFRDITTKKAIEDEIEKSQRIESVGLLAGGIAHDFNNLMTAILGNIALAKGRSKPGDMVYERLVETEKATLRAKDLTQQLLTFSKGGAPIKKAASIIDILTDTADFVLSGSNVRAIFDLPSGLWPVEIDSGQISQVIDNIVANARDSMPNGGRIWVTAENHEMLESSHPSLPSGKYVRVSIIDEGIGIPKENIGGPLNHTFLPRRKGAVSDWPSYIRSLQGMVVI